MFVKLFNKLLIKSNIKCCEIKEKICAFRKKFENWSILIEQKCPPFHITFGYGSVENIEMVSV